MNPSVYRLIAERSDNPEMYEIAAAELEAAGMPCSAAACRDRAKHYREISHEHPAPEVYRNEYLVGCLVP